MQERLRTFLPRFGFEFKLKKKNDSFTVKGGIAYGSYNGIRLTLEDGEPLRYGLQFERVLHRLYGLS